MGIRSTPLALGFAVVSAVTVALSPVPLWAQDVLIGTGSAEAAHRDIGRLICRQVSKSPGEASCGVLPIEGRDAAEPLAVLIGVHNAGVDMGLVTSDWQFYATSGTGPVAFMDVKFDSLRALFSLHSEPFTLVARRDSGISGLDDLAGKRVNIGHPGSRQRTLMERVMQAKNWTSGSFQLAEELNESEQSLALCHNRVQAMVLAVAHPDPELAKTLEICDAQIVTVAGAEIAALVGDNPYFAATEVPAGLYAGQEKAVKTFGLLVTAVSSEDIDEETIYAATKSVIDSLPDLRRRHPALGALSPDGMMKDGLSAPLHPGALRYYRERGMM